VRVVEMKKITLNLIIFIALLSVCMSAYGEQVREFVIIDKSASASVRPSPNSSSSLGKLKAGKKVEILEKQDVRGGMLVVTWYKIKFKGKDGWISQYVTMGDIIKENISSGSIEKSRALGADDVRMGNFNQDAKDNFKQYALDTLAVTWFEYQSDWQIWVKLEPYKYTTKANVKEIAQYLARAYKTQTQYKGAVVVTVWDLNKDKIWANGKVK